jgi:hypothetical protein
MTDDADFANLVLAGTLDKDWGQKITLRERDRP